MADSGALFTCISCAVAFSEPALQRAHFASDWHRYNMKRRVATLPPVSAQNFNQKVLERREQTAVRVDPRSMTCEACKKPFATENAYRSHMASKKHQEREAKYNASKAASSAGPSSSSAMELDEVPSAPVVFSAPTKTPAPRLFVEADATEEDVEMSIEAKIAASRSHLTTSSCLFCNVTSPSIAANVKHMSSVHSFFIPDSEYLTDLPGLLTYLGEKLSIGNTCIYCPSSKEFGSLEAVRAHMRDKGHCKLAYDTEEEKLEVGDYYDFEESYPDVHERRLRRAERRKRKLEEKARLESMREEIDGDEEEGEEWEEMEEDGEDADEVVVIEGKSDDSEDEDSDDDSDIVPNNGLSIAADGLSLRLPSGRTLGHRSLRIYYSQNIRPTSSEPLTNSSTALTTKLHNVRAMLNDPSEALIPVRGGNGAFGRGLEMMKARNAGEAKWAKKMARDGRDVRAREAHKTRVAFVHNSQKHFRDPLLQ